MVAKAKPYSTLETIREDVSRVGGTVGELNPMAQWVELHGMFTPDHLRKLAKLIEKQYGGKK